MALVEARPPLLALAVAALWARYTKSSSESESWLCLSPARRFISSTSWVGREVLCAGLAAPSAVFYYASVPASTAGPPSSIIIPSIYTPHNTAFINTQIHARSTRPVANRAITRGISMRRQERGQG